MKEAAGGGQLWRFNGFGARGKALGTVRKVGKSEVGMVLVVAWVGQEQDFESRLETDGWLKDKRSAQGLQVARGSE